MEVDLGQLDQAAAALIERVGAYLHDGRGVHIETAIAAVGSLAGVAILRVNHPKLRGLADKRP